MRKILCLIIASLITLTVTSRYIVLMDGNDRTPIIGGSVFSSNGLILGITDDKGKITVGSQDYPLSFRCVGYEPLTTASCDKDTVFMLPASYNLNEVVVTPGDRPISRIVTYAREYCTGATKTDTLQLYCEYMLEYYFADGKVKGYSKYDERAKPLNVKRYARIVNTSGLDSLMRPKSEDEISSISMMSFIGHINNDKIELTDAMKKGVSTDTIPGKYFPKIIYSLNNGYFTMECDFLCNYKTHSVSPWFFKLLGFTMEIQEGKGKQIYNRTETGKYGISDLIYSTGNIHILGKGRFLKKLIGVKDEMHLDCFIEQYPVEIEYLTVEEYKEQKKSSHLYAEDFRIPNNLQPVAPAIQNLINRIDREIPIKDAPVSIPTLGFNVL